MTYKLTNFLGINTRLPDSALHVRTRQVQGDYLRDAVNVDIDNAGRLTHRKVSSLVQALTAPHSLYMTDETNGLLVIDSILYAITLPSYTQTLLKVLTSNAAMSYVRVGDDVFCSNGTDSGRIRSGTWFPLALPTPSAPSLSIIGGALLPGWYQVAISYANATTGEEGGISASANIQLTSDGGIRVPLPGATTGATHVNVYLSAANGTTPYLAATVATGASMVDLTTLGTGRDAPSRYEEPLTAGTLFLSSGRLCSYSGNTVYVGLPHKFGYYLPAEGFIPFPEEVSVAVDAQAGFYVAADKTYWIPNEGVISDVLPYGAVPGTAFATPDKSVVGWFGLQGFVLASPSGEVNAVMSDNIDLTPPSSGFSMTIDDEYRRVVSCGWCMNLANNAVTRYEDWNFTSFSGSYGTQAGGIYTLTSGNVAWSVDFGQVDLGSDTEKHLPNAYLGVESSDAMTLRVVAPGRYGGDYTYPARAFSEDLNMQRIDVGKGLRANWFQLYLSSTEGADFRLTHIDFIPANSRRRI